ncbi:MAG: DUF4147 domain-containing protein [Chloroflexi bacterium]|nr:DUF4147 domain-containing protein [Chloroflexota bacterium]
MFIQNFDQLATTRARRLALETGVAAVEAVQPARLMGHALRLRGDVLTVRGRRYSLRRRRVWVLGAGKAARAMAAAVETVLGPGRIHAGAVIAPADAPGPSPRKVRVLQGEHPVPGPGSFAATRELLGVIEQVGPDDLALWLISGGASALLAAPAPGISLEDKRAANRALLGSGASIDEMNVVRKHLSAVKGGWLARRLSPARVVTLALSDVASGRWDTLGSGPTLPDPTTFGDALEVVERYGIASQVPAAVLRHLEAGAHGQRPETPKPGDPVFGRARVHLLGEPGTAAAAAARAARVSGVPRAAVLTDQLQGEARLAAKVLGAILRYRAAAAPRRTQALVAAGETTVTVQGGGRGGRCQELAAALIPEVAGLPGCAVLCLATDGRDNLPGTGGALVDGETASRAEALGLSVAAHLAGNDTAALHQRLGTLLETEATGTNVADLVVCVLGCR